MLKTVNFGHPGNQNNRDARFVRPYQIGLISLIQTSGLINVAVAEEINMVIGDFYAGLLLDPLQDLGR